jgi:ferrochelatase
MAYGTPGNLDEVEAYYTDIRGGRRPSPEALENLRERYRKVGGKTPLLEITRDVATGLQARLDRAEPGRYRVYVGMRHWHPYIGEVVPRMADEGIREAVAIALAPHYSRMSIGSYRKSVEDAVGRLATPIDFSYVETWHAQPRFRKLIAERIRAARDRFPAEARDEAVVLFSAHSLPRRILEWDDPYPRELGESAAAIAKLAGVKNWHFTYQSAGKTGEPWLGPDLLEAIEELAAEGKRSVLSVPFGFVADHLEILYDVDLEAKGKARELGLDLRRIALPNADPEFIEVLASILGVA